MLSRVADSLYWLSRYVERAENTARILDVNLQVTLDSDQSGPLDSQAEWQPILATLEDMTLFSKHFPVVSGENVCEFVTFAKENPNSIWSCVSTARENARTVRDYISSEMWERLNSMWLWIDSATAKQHYGGSGIDFYRRIVDYSHQFQGTTDATLTRHEGWSFMHIGKFLERADSVSRILDLKYHILLPQGEKVGGTVDTVQWQAVLKSCSALEAYRKLHMGQVTPWSVAEFLLLHDSFPRSLRFCVDALDDALHRISGCDRHHFSNPAERLAGRLASELHYASISEILLSGLHEYLDGMQRRLGDIGSAMRKTYCGATDEIDEVQSQVQGAA